MEFGETHVPDLDGTQDAKVFWWIKDTIGDIAFGILQLTTHLGLGWPLYILLGKTGGPKYGTTNHFWPFFPFNNGEAELFPESQKIKVLLSDIGIVIMIGVLYLWAQATSFTNVALIYGLPYLNVNLWLVLYTWL